MHSHFNVGDRGQRYEVRFIDAATLKERVMGWTYEEDGGALLESAKLWPIARNPRVVDRRAKGYKSVDAKA